MFKVHRKRNTKANVFLSAENKGREREGERLLAEKVTRARQGAERSAEEGQVSRFQSFKTGNSSGEGHRSFDLGSLEICVTLKP
jgi:hypothetical protein